MSLYFVAVARQIRLQSKTALFEIHTCRPFTSYQNHSDFSSGNLVTFRCPDSKFRCLVLGI